MEIAIDCLLQVLEQNDPYAAAHSKRVARWAVELGRRLGLERSELDTLWKAAYLHDIGKVFVGREILGRKGPLTQVEYSRIKRHPADGAELIMKVMERADLAVSVYHHHERIDGKGYPDGLKGEEIPLISRIIFVTDAFDAMMTRTYNGGKRKWVEALKELIENAGTQFEPRVVAAFLECVLRAKGVGLVSWLGEVLVLELDEAMGGASPGGS